MTTDNRNVKFTAGKYYCWQNSDYSIEILGVVMGMAMCKGWKVTTEPVRKDENGNEYIRLGNQTYYAFCKE